MSDHFMLSALQLAEKGRNTVSPNPMVGCVIVNNGVVVGSGYHRKAGEAHAEIHALQEAGSQAKSATLYVTLEPCAHHGRTPPCVDAIIAAGVSKVVVATLDPNTLVSGKGVKKLRDAGIDVEIGCCKTQADKLNEIFFHYITNKTPFVICKWAMSLDGKTITAVNDNRQLSSASSQEHCHQIRASVDVILVGGNTIRTDNPMLTVRFGDIAKQPLRIVLSNSGNLPASANVLTQNGKTMVVSTNANNLKSLPKEVEKLILPNQNGQVDLSLLLAELGKREITSVLVEGGMHVHHQFFRKKLVNQVMVYLAPTFVGDLPNKIPLTNIEMRNIGGDFHFTTQGNVEYV